MSSNGILYFAPLFLVIAANSCYHLISKSVSSEANPFLGLAAAYGTAFLLSIVFFLLTKRGGFAAETAHLKPVNFVQGVVLLGVESGWLWMYGAGWQVSRASIIANICTSSVLFGVGTLGLKESTSVEQALGFLICLAGVCMVNS